MYWLGGRVWAKALAPRVRMEASIANMAMRIEAEACGFAFSGFCTRFSVSTRGERDAVASLESLRGTSRWGLGRKLSDEPCFERGNYTTKFDCVNRAGICIQAGH
jgi:hypothetical protein